MSPKEPTTPFPPDLIPSRQLTADDVPSERDRWWPDISTFALTFDGYAYLGGVDPCMALAAAGWDSFRQSRRLARNLSLDAHRACLFAVQRTHRDQPPEPLGEMRDYVEALLVKIRKMATMRHPTRAGYSVERRAFEIVWAEELARGRRPQRLSKIQERAEGCDLLSHPPDGAPGPLERVEIKGFGNQLLLETGGFEFGTDVNREQYERAQADPENWRLEVVANLGADFSRVERLTLLGNDVVARARPWKYSVRLDGLQSNIRRASEEIEP